MHIQVPPHLHLTYLDSRRVSRTDTNIPAVATETTGPIAAVTPEPFGTSGRGWHVSRTGTKPAARDAGGAHAGASGHGGRRAALLEQGRV